MNLDWMVLILLVVSLVATVVISRAAPAEHSDEDRAATVAVAKVFELCIVNVVLAFLCGFVASRLGFSLWDSALDGSLLARIGLGQVPKWLAWIVVGSVIEAPIVLAVVLLPSMRLGGAHTFSERQLVAAFSVIAFVPWLMATDPVAFRIFNLVMDGALLVIAAVFFVAKSVVSRRISYGTLAVAVMPLANLVAGKLWSRS